MKLTRVKKATPEEESLSQDTETPDRQRGRIETSQMCKTPQENNFLLKYHRNIYFYLHMLIRYRLTVHAQLVPKRHTWQMFKFRAYDVAPGDHSINVK